MQQPLHTRDPLRRFSDRAQDYARFRPTYPPQAIATLLHDLGDPATLTAADVGAGTGISSRLLADAGVWVWAIEPNAAMREAAEPHPRVTFREATAEQTGLGDRCVDLVTCCQAFHWFEPTVALAEFHRILKPGGRVALVWNDRNINDPFTADLTEILYSASDRTIFDRKDRKSPAALADSPLFTGFYSHTVDWVRSLDLDSLIGLVLSASYMPKTGVAHTQLLHNLVGLFEQWSQLQPEGVVVSLAYRTYIYSAFQVYEA